MSCPVHRFRPDGGTLPESGSCDFDFHSNRNGGTDGFSSWASIPYPGSQPYSMPQKCDAEGKDVVGRCSRLCCAYCAVWAVFMLGGLGLHQVLGLRCSQCTWGLFARAHPPCSDAARSLPRNMLQTERCRAGFSCGHLRLPGLADGDCAQATLIGTGCHLFHADPKLPFGPWNNASTGITSILPKRAAVVSSTSV